MSHFTADTPEMAPVEFAGVPHGHRLWQRSDSDRCCWASLSAFWPYLVIGRKFLSSCYWKLLTAICDHCKRTHWLKTLRSWPVNYVNSLRKLCPEGSKDDAARSKEQYQILTWEFLWGQAQDRGVVFAELQPETHNPAASGSSKSFDNQLGMVHA